MSVIMRPLRVLLCLQFLELLGPRHRRRKADVVGTGERADFGHVVFGANVWIGVSAAVGLFFRVERMQGSMKCFLVTHVLGCDFSGH